MGVESWKSFEKNEVTHSMAHYLMAIQTLLAERGYARVTDVAEYLEITRASASVSIGGLKAKGLVEEDERHFLRLAPHSRDLVQQILANRRLLIRLLRDVLKIDATQAEEDACKTEHLLSPESGIRLFRLLRHIFGDSERLARIHEIVTSEGADCPGLENCEVCPEFHECILGGRP